MKYAIIGSGKSGTHLGHSFARKNIEVAIANSRGPETLGSLRHELGRSVVPQSIQDALKAEITFRRFHFLPTNDVAKRWEKWDDRIIADATNSFHVAPEELGGRLSSEIAAKAFAGARLVKGFRHLPAGQLGTNPHPDRRKQAVFVSSNDADASARVAATADRPGFAPVELGRLDLGGAPLHVVSGKPGGRLFQNLEKIG